MGADDHVAHTRREVIVRRLACEALEAAIALERRPGWVPPLARDNPVARRILEIAGEYYRGERTPTPRVRAIARRIIEDAERAERRRRRRGLM